MAKRVYTESVKKWAKGVGISGTTLIGLIFMYLLAVGAISNVSYSGDVVCAGTELDPCYAYINFTANEDIFIYPTDYDPWGRDTLFNFDPNVKSWKLERSWGNYWWEYDLSKPCTSPRCGAKQTGEPSYSLAWRKGKTYQIRITAYKNDPTEDIKWGAFSGVDEIDPAWFGVDRDIGYEFLDNNSVVHIWNTQDDYFFDKNSGIQLTNHFQDYWTKNIFCLGYYSGETWNKIKCSDELTGFNKNIETDNSTYVNATLWKDISYGQYDLRLGVGYHLGLDDENLSITIYAKNLGIDIPFDLGFAWKVQDVNIPGLGEDYIDINGSSYLLNDSYDLTFKNMNESYFRIHDVTKYLRLDWDNSLNYKVKMFGDGNQSNFYIATLINAGHFNPGQEKQTTFQWIDADITVDGDVSGATNENTQPKSLVWINKDTGYIFLLDNMRNLFYRKTTDAGLNWGARVTVKLSTVQKFVIWYDKWTKNDTGTIIHIALVQSAVDDIIYNSLDTSDDSLGGEVTVFDGVSANFGNWATGLISIVKAEGGNIYVGGWIDNVGEHGFWRATDSPATSFTSRTSLTEGNEVDRIMLLAGNEADSNDIWSIYQDVSTNEITLKVYDDSANSWSESSVIDTMVENVAYFGFDTMDRHSDGHAILVMWNEHQSSSADLVVHDITNITIFSEKANIVTNNFAWGIVSLLINQQNDDLYAGYNIDTSVGAIVYQKSINGGTNWGGQTAMSVTVGDHKLVIGGTSVGDSGGRWMPIWFNDDTRDLITNFDNSIEIPEVEPPSEDTCTYTSGNWDVDCSDFCNITSQVDVSGNDINIIGDGIFTTDSDITNYGELFISGGAGFCEVRCWGGCFVD